MRDAKASQPAKSFDAAMTDIAIIGMAGRFPGARNIEQFWQNLLNGVESITLLSEEQVLASGVDPATMSRPDFVNAEFVLDDVELFDAAFFGMTPKEAAITDPQQRLFLECAWEALESAGYTPETYKGLIGVYAGVGLDSYLLSNLYPSYDFIELMTSPEIKLGNDKDHLTTRVSYKLNLRGPSITVQTTCSTSLVASVLACQGLLGYQCDMALAGGVTIKIPQKTGTLALKGAASPDGHCRAFDAKAQGTAGGAGAGVVVLKRLKEALSAGDHIYAVIKGSAINNDGSDKVGYTAPSVKGQAKVIALAQAIAGVEAETISYIEAHGTGTRLGDPIEMAALTQAFRASTHKKGFCAVGSAKTNVGHTDTAAGAVGLIKAALSLKHQVIPPSLNFEEPNPEIDFANSPFYVNTQLAEWKADSTPRRAGVSAFGLGGTNVHMVLQEPPDVEPSLAARPWQLLMLSARTVTALDAATANLAGYLKRQPALDLADVAYTLQVGRRVFDCRRALVCRDLDDAVAALETLDPQRISTACLENSERSVVFMFPGTGALYVNMAVELYQVEPVFRQEVDRCAELLTPHLSCDLRSVLYPAAEQAKEAAVQLRRGPVALSALFVNAYALAKLLMSWGIRPQAMIGHSLGEYVAACLAGVFSLEDALSLVALRGLLFEQLPEGAMLSVSLTEKEVEPLLSDKLALAAVNGPAQCVVSGAVEAVDDVVALLIDRGVEFSRLDIPRAGHSFMVDSILETFAGAVKKLRLQAPDIPYLSNVTGAWITAAQAIDPNYWVRHLRQTVRFSDGLCEILAEPSRLLLEVGSGRTLSSLAKKHLDDAASRVVLSTMRHPRDPQSDVAFLLNTVSQLWLAGVQIDWSGFYGHERRRRVPLPTYPFERQRYWVEPPRGARQAASWATGLGKKPDVADWFYIPSWKRAALPYAFKTGALAGQQRRWLLFVGQDALSAEVAGRLTQEGQEVIRVIAGEQFEKVGAQTYTINPQRREDYQALLAELETSEFPTRFVHLWSLEPDGHGPPGSECFESGQHAGLDSLLFWAQSVARRGATESLAMWVVSSNVHQVTGQEVCCPQKSALLASCLVIAQEYPHIVCHGIDFALVEGPEGPPERLAERLMAEISANAPDGIVAYRGEHRWLPTWEGLRLDGDAGHRTRLREGGVYLITGGLEGVSYELAQYLAAAVRPKLALVAPLASPKGDAGKLGIDMEAEQDYIRQQEREIEEQVGVEPFPAGLEKTLDALCASYIYQYWRTSGVDVQQGSTLDLAELRRKLRILPKFAKFCDFFVSVLAEEGIIRRDGDKFRFVRSPEMIRNPATVRAELESSYPEHRAAVEFLEHCVQHYDRALSGEIEAISVLLPDGSFDQLKPLVEAGLKFSHVRVYVELIARLIADRILKTQDKKLRILEVGAGSGELAWAMAPRLQGQNAEYHFTDIGRLFVVNAQRKARQEGLDFMQFGVLDISQDPTAQGYEKHGFDVILAYNVIHATESIVETMSHLQELLAPNGVMLILEVATARRSTMMIDGLAEGWWYFADHDIRPHSPLLTHRGWDDVLRRLDFWSGRVYPQGEEERARSDYALIVVQQSPHNGSDEKQQQQAWDNAHRIKALENRGAEVLVVQADAADVAQVQAAIEQAQARFGELHGVIHAVEPQMPGALALDEALRGQALDFRLLIHAPLLAADGDEFAAHCAANLFSDAWASQRQGRWMSVSWDVGPVGEPETPEATVGPVVTPEKAGEALRRLLSVDAVAQVVVSPRYLQVWSDLWRKSGPPGETRPEEKADVLSLYPRPSLRSTYVAPRDEIERAVAEIWREVFGIAQIGIYDNFYELGGESLMATRIISRVSDLYKAEVPIRRLFENPTILGLAEAIKEARSSGLERREPVIARASREAYRGKRLSKGEIQLPDAILSQKDKRSTD